LRKTAWLLTLVLLFTGCSGKREELDRAMKLRTSLLAGDCSFDVEITADYGDELYAFAVSCRGDSRGNLAFTVTSPETIAGITGVIEQGEGKLTFENTVLAIPLLADGQLTPVSAPWILLKTLQGGYLTAAGMEEDLLRLTVQDSYAEDALQLDIWLDREDMPVRADVLYDGRRILAMKVTNFQIQ